MPPKIDPSLLPSAPDLQFEMQLWEAGIRGVAGIDEAGRGALAGPVAAAAVVLPIEASLPQILSGVRDSKQMSPSARSYWAEKIKETAMEWAVGWASHIEIDTLGILLATLLAIERAIAGLDTPPEHLLLDYIRLPECAVPQTALVKGDRRALSIAAASVLAKTWRDALMRQLDLEYPGYAFASNKGYGTLAHRQALGRLGSSPVHRKSFTVKGLGEMG